MLVRSHCILCLALKCMMPGGSSLLTCSHVQWPTHLVEIPTCPANGTDTERRNFHKYFESLRMVLGTGIISSTLNPRDKDSALTLSFITEDVW